MPKGIGTSHRGGDRKSTRPAEGTGKPLSDVEVAKAHAETMEKREARKKLVINRLEKKTKRGRDEGSDEGAVDDDKRGSRRPQEKAGSGEKNKKKPGGGEPQVPHYLVIKNVSTNWPSIHGEALKKWVQPALRKVNGDAATTPAAADEEDNSESTAAKPSKSNKRIVIKSVVVREEVQSAAIELGYEKDEPSLKLNATDEGLASAAKAVAKQMSHRWYYTQKPPVTCAGVAGDDEAEDNEKGRTIVHNVARIVSVTGTMSRQCGHGELHKCLKVLPGYITCRVKSPKQFHVDFATLDELFSAKRLLDEHEADAGLRLTLQLTKTMATAFNAQSQERLPAIPDLRYPTMGQPDDDMGGESAPAPAVAAVDATASKKRKKPAGKVDKNDFAAMAAAKVSTQQHVTFNNEEDDE